MYGPISIVVWDQTETSGGSVTFQSGLCPHSGACVRVSLSVSVPLCGCVLEGGRLFMASRQIKSMI